MVKSFEPFAVFSLLVIRVVSQSNDGISCKNDRGQDVPWYFIYKLPNGAKNEKEEKPYPGTKYLYVDTETLLSAQHWTLSDRTIDSSESALGETIVPLTKLDEHPEMAYAVYNDMMDGKPLDGGHTKGLLMFEGKRGVWLIHSVPNFPKNLQKHVYQYPEQGERYGQIALCVTFPSTEVDKIARHLRLQNAFIIAGHAPSVWNKYTNFVDLINAEVFNEESPEMTDELVDVSDRCYKSFSKNGNYKEDVYLGLVAPTLHSNLLVSTWRRNGGKLKSHCNDPFTIENVQELNFDLGDKGSVLIKSTFDHSKWAVAKDEGSTQVCVGTLNRVKSQFERGGGTLCFHNTLLHKLLITTVQSYESCHTGAEEDQVKEELHLTFQENKNENIDNVVKNEDKMNGQNKNTLKRGRQGKESEKMRSPQRGGRTA